MVTIRYSPDRNRDDLSPYLTVFHLNLCDHHKPLNKLSIYFIPFIISLSRAIYTAALFSHCLKWSFTNREESKHSPIGIGPICESIDVEMRFLIWKFILKLSTIKRLGKLFIMINRYHWWLMASNQINLFTKRDIFVGIDGRASIVAQLITCSATNSINQPWF